ncbi:CU044_5270 family protein [Micromonospora sp. NPDC047707]|uniref:CU044_5270 family protein n=1 Tax=Micromonospora sp. NPDC047707 TaxID=3154498 RepID=UPI003453AC52
MNASPIQPDSDERAELTRLLPGPVERELPSDRHQRLQEFVMSQIHQDLRTAEQATRRSPKRRFVSLASAATAVVAAAVAVGIGVSNSDHSSPPPATTALSSQQILLAAATTAERTPEGSGAYWHVKVVFHGDKEAWQSEYWAKRDGHHWFMDSRKTNGKTVRGKGTEAFRLGGPVVTFEQLQALPTEPGSLKAWIADSLKNSDIRSAANPEAPEKEEAVFYGLVSLVSQLPAPPNVRAAAFRAIASYPNVKSLGEVESGQELLVSLAGQAPGRIVVDPASSRIRETNWYVPADGGSGVTSPPGGTFKLSSEWTDSLPK